MPESERSGSVCPSCGSDDPSYLWYGKGNRPDDKPCDNPFHTPTDKGERSGSVERRWSIAVCDGCWKLAKTAPGLDVYCDCDAYQEDDAQIVAVEVVPLTTLNRQREALEDIAVWSNPEFFGQRGDQVVEWIQTRANEALSQQDSKP